MMSASCLSGNYIGKKKKIYIMTMTKGKNGKKEVDEPRQQSEVLKTIRSSNPTRDREKYILGYFFGYLTRVTAGAAPAKIQGGSSSRKMPKPNMSGEYRMGETSREDVTEARVPPRMKTHSLKRARVLLEPPTD